MPGWWNQSEPLCACLWVMETVGCLQLDPLRVRFFSPRNQKHEGQGNLKYCQGSMCDVTELWNLLGGRKRGVKTIPEHHDLDVLTGLRNDLRQEDLSQAGRGGSRAERMVSKSSTECEDGVESQCEDGAESWTSSCALMDGWRMCREQFRWEPEQPQATACVWPCVQGCPGGGGRAQRPWAKANGWQKKEWPGRHEQGQGWRSRSFPGKKSSSWKKQKPRSRGIGVLGPQDRSQMV